MKTLTSEELLIAITHGVNVQQCSDCRGTGTKFNAHGKSRQCPTCKGRRKVVMLHREPLAVPFTNEWEVFLNVNPGMRWHES